MLPSNIRNIILDLGGVIINLDQQKPFAAFKQLFAANYAEIEAAFVQNNLFNEFEIGKVSADEFVLFFLNYNPTINVNSIKKIWNSMLLDIPKERIELIRKLTLNYNIFLLSNTNEIHLEHINNCLFDVYKITSINSMFKKAYFSNEIGLRKPNPKIFKLVLEENNLIASETLFVDDSIEHIKTAQKLGLHTKHLVNQTLTSYFNEN